jgi:hypothetical protein
MPENKSMPVKRSTLPTRIIGALLLAGATVGFFGVGVNQVSGSTMLQEVTEGASAPAMYVTRLIFPYGQHSGLGAQYWNWVFWPVDVLFYTIVWFIVITMLWSTRRTVYSR